MELPLAPRPPKLVNRNEDGEPSLAVPPYEYTPLDIESGEQRFLVLYPCAGDKRSADNYVRCKFVNQKPSEAEPFIAVTHGRGYRKLWQPIEIDGEGLFVSIAIEMFLRYFRDSDQPKRIWIRHVCLDEPDKGERETYWTREFSDKMYAMASSVVDMTRYLAEKADAGEKLQSYTGDYSKRRKLWNEYDQDLERPQSFPNRLGFKPSPDHLIDQYPYVQLDIVADEIRLLVISPSKDPAAPIDCGMSHCLFYSTFYHALSYTWGQPEPKSTLLVNSQLVTVRQSLELALRAIRRPDDDVAIWVDALCIDQNNLPERNRQVPRMRDVYDSASVVVAYVGEPDEDSDMALDLIPAMQMPMARRDDKGNWIFHKREIDPELVPSLCAALYRFLSRPYFRRIWVLQENAVASLVSVMCGKRCDVTINQVWLASHNLASMLESDSELARQVDESYYQKQDSTTDPLTYIAKLSYFRKLLSRGMSDEGLAIFRQTVQYQQMWKEETPGYLEALVMARDFEASDPRDKIFALRSIAADTEGLEYKTNYADSVTKTYTDFVKAWCERHGSLDIIAAAETADQSAEFYQSAASWCPDWSTPSIASCLIRKEMLSDIRMCGSLDGKLYAADGGVDAKGKDLFHFEGNTLCVTGIIVDQISSAFAETEFEDDEDGAWTKLPRSIAKYFHLASGVLQTIRDDKISTYDDPLQAYEAMVHGDVPSAWLKVEDHPDPNAESKMGEEYICVVEKSRHVTQYAGSYDRGAAQRSMRAVLRGRIPFMSKNGYMGLAPSWITKRMQQRPLLAILAGCSVPVILWEDEDDSYSFGGVCFVQGWMEGEYLAEQFGVDDFVEFWSAMKGSGMLKLV